MEIQAELGNTVIMITHDVDEAVLLSDRIVMMTNGPAATIGEILDIQLERPRGRVELRRFRHPLMHAAFGQPPPALRYRGGASSRCSAPAGRHR